MKIIDKINDKEVEIKTMREYKDYVSNVEFIHDVFLIHDDDVTLIYPANVSFPCKTTYEEDFETLEFLKNIRTDLSKLVGYLTSNSKAGELFQKNMSVHTHNPIDMCFEEFTAKWSLFVWEYEFYMKNEL